MLSIIICSVSPERLEQVTRNIHDTIGVDYEIIAIKKYELSGQKRAFLFIQKIAETHKKYPRMIGEPLQNPIK